MLQVSSVFCHIDACIHHPGAIMLLRLAVPSWPSTSILSSQPHLWAVPTQKAQSRGHICVWHPPWSATTRVAHVILGPLCFVLGGIAERIAFLAVFAQARKWSEAKEPNPGGFYTCIHGPCCHCLCAGVAACLHATLPHAYCVGRWLSDSRLTRGAHTC